MEIEVVWGTAEGQTALGAFDAALAAAGIHNYNLVTLSSVVPAETAVVEVGTHDGAWPVGELVGVVVAETRSSESGRTVCAGLGWDTADEGGVFYEATGQSRADVRGLLDRGLASARTVRGGWTWDGDATTRVVAHTVADTGAAVVAAVYGPLDGARTASF